MDTAKKKQAILYIEANRLFFYPGLAGETLQLAFPPDTVSDLEVLNPQKLLDLIVLFLQAQKIPPSEVLCIFASPMVFEKDFSEDEKKEVTQAFLDYVPFDEILSKSFPSNKKIRLFAINRQLFNICKQACEKSNCSMAGVVAYTSLTEMIPELSQKVDLPLLLARFDNCKQFSLESTTIQETVAVEKQQPKKQNKRIYLLLSVFGMLVLVLVVMIFFTMQPPSQITNTPRTLPNVTIPTSTTSVPTVTSSQSASPQ